MVFGDDHNFAHVINKCHFGKCPSSLWMREVRKFAPEISLADAVCLLLDFFETYVPEKVADVVHAPHENFTMRREENTTVPTSASTTTGITSSLCSNLLPPPSKRPRSSMPETVMAQSSRTSPNLARGIIHKFEVSAWLYGLLRQVLPIVIFTPENSIYVKEIQEIFTPIEPSTLGKEVIYNLSSYTPKGLPKEYQKVCTSTVIHSSDCSLLFY